MWYSVGMSNNNGRIEILQYGKQYIFNFTHKKNIHGIVCDVDVDRKSFVVYDVNTKGYESIPQRRFLNASPVLGK